MRYKLIASDVDGVWTDGSFYYSREGDDYRRFTTKDSFGISLCRLAGIMVLIVSTEKNEMVAKRMKKLNIRHVKQGISNKLKAITDFCSRHDILLSEVAYIGDDMNDFHVLGKAGLFACPADAYPAIKEKAGLVLQTRGGAGVFREFVETLLYREGKLEETYQKYLEECLKK